MFQVLVWHTKTQQASSRNEEKTLKQYGLNTSLFEEVWLIYIVLHPH